MHNALLPEVSRQAHLRTSLKRPHCFLAYMQSIDAGLSHNFPLLSSPQWISIMPIIFLPQNIHARVLRVLSLNTMRVASVWHIQLTTAR
jgi:hypothetical protein